MAEPVIIDDGGCTRLKQCKGPGVTGKMDGLLDVTDVSGTNLSQDFALGPFNQITVLCVDRLGNAGPPAPGVFPIAMAPGDTFDVRSGQHRISGRIVNNQPAGTAQDCEITVKAIGGVEPMVEARQSKRQRRYIVSNAPAIDQVVINAAGPSVAYPIPANTIYTAVILS